VGREDQPAFCIAILIDNPFDRAEISFGLFEEIGSEIVQIGDTCVKRLATPATAVENLSDSLLGPSSRGTFWKREGPKRGARKQTFESSLIRDH
jgi:hypothetical protein